MLILRKIAVTGFLASGKSSVCQLLSQHGAYVVDADKIAHHILEGNEAREQVINLLGQTVVIDSHISRKKIASEVFKDPQKLDALEKIIHPLVFQKIHQEYEFAKNFPYLCFVAEVPLLYEAGWEKFFDTIITVVSDNSLCKKRFKERGGDEKEYDLRMKRRTSPKQRDQTIYNNGSIDALQTAVERFIRSSI